MKTARKRILVLLLSALMALILLPATALAADPGAPTGGYPGSGVGGDGVRWYQITYDEAGTVDWVILPYGAAQPTAAQVKAHQDAGGAAVAASGAMETISDSPTVHTAIFLRSDGAVYTSLAPDKYNFFVVCTDAEGNTSDVTHWQLFWYIDDMGYYHDFPYSFEVTEQLTFTVTDGVNPIAGAKVKIGSTTNTTNDEGKTTFTLSGGNYGYLVQAAGYQGVSGSYFADKQTDTKTVTLAAGTGGEYSAILNVKDDKGTNLQNAQVTIGTDTRTADAGGNVEFFLTPGIYDYTASAMGRITKSGSVTVTDDNISASVVLETDPAGVDLVIYAHQKGKLGNEMDAVLSANRLGIDVVRSLTVHGGVMDGDDFDYYKGVKKLCGYWNSMFASVDLSDTALEDDTLPENAFYYCTHLASILLPDSVEEVDHQAFTYCPLTSFAFPDSVKVIGNAVFEFCSHLTSVTIPAGVTSIGAYLFSTDWGESPDPVTEVTMLSANPAGIAVDTNAFHNSGRAVLSVSAPASLSDYTNDGNDGSITDGKWYGLWIIDPAAPAPVITGSSTGVWSGDTIVFYFSSTTIGQYYYTLVPDGASEPVIDTSGAGTALDGDDFYGYFGEGRFTRPAAASDLYIVAKGLNGKPSNILKMDIPAAGTLPVNITIAGHHEGDMWDEVNEALTEANLSYNFDKVGGLTVNGGTISAGIEEDYGDAGVISGLYSLTNADFSGTSFEDNAVPAGFLTWSNIKTIILPGSVEAIGDDSLSALFALESITLGSSTPPAVGEYVFGMVPDGAMVYVPAGSLAAYLAVDDGDTTDDKWYGLTVVESTSASTPALSSGSVNRTSDTEAVIGFTTSEAGTAYYTVVDSGATAPNKAAVAAGTSLGAVSGTVTGKPVTLTAGAKDIYVVVKNAAGNISDVLKIEAAAFAAPPAFVAVTGITGVPATATAGTDLTLTGTVAPPDATNQTIVWSIKNQGTTGASITGNTLSTTGAGTVTVTATIVSGASATTAYTQDFDIIVNGILVPGMLEEQASSMIIQVEGLFAPNAELIVIPLNVDETTRQELEALLSGKETVAAFEIHVTPAGAFQPPLTLHFHIGTQYNGRIVYVLHRLSDGGTEQFTVVVANGEVVITVQELSPFLLAVDPQIVITSQPQDITVMVGQTAAFSVSAAGIEPLSYQWQKKTGATALWENIEGAVNPDHTTSQAKLSNSGFQYRVLITDALAGSATSNAATLTVIQPPDTGDDSQPALYLALMLLFTASMILLLRKRKTV